MKLDLERICEFLLNYLIMYLIISDNILNDLHAIELKKTY